VEEKPVSLPGSSPYRDNMRKHIRLLPIFARRDGDDAHVSSLLIHWIRCHGVKKVFDEMLEVRAGLHILILASERLQILDMGPTILVCSSFKR
jgi:hypothetical protein